MTKIVSSGKKAWKAPVLKQVSIMPVTNSNTNIAGDAGGFS